MKTPWKSPTFYLGLCAAFIAIGGAIDSKWNVFGLVPQSVTPYIAILCVFLFALSIFFLIVSTIGWISAFDYLQLLKIRLGEYLLGGENSSIRYAVHEANQQDINKIFKLCLETIGVGISRPRKMKAWLRQNNEIFFKLIPIADEDEHLSRNIQGYFCLLPLNSKAVKHLENHELDGASFTTDHICKAGGKVSAWYIGGVAGRNKYAKISAMRNLKSHIKKVVKKESYLYTRPVTTDGLKWVNRLGFEPIEQDGHVEKDELCKLKVSPEDLDSILLNKAFQRTSR